MRKPQITIVAAKSLNGCIGAKGTIPWYLPADLRRFRSITLDKPIIMGRKTWESLPHLLDRRDHIVLTSRKARVKPLDGITVVTSLDEALDAAGDAPEVCIIGGGKVYEQFLPHTDVMHLTIIEQYAYGDVFFPIYDAGQWLPVARVDYPADDVSLLRYSFRTFQKRGFNPDAQRA